MRDIELTLPAVWLGDLASIADRLEAECLALRLRIALKTTLKSFSGCTHWHFKPAGARQPGTLELTWWPSQRRAWLKIAAGRASAWQPPVVDALCARLSAAAACEAAHPPEYDAPA